MISEDSKGRVRLRLKIRPSRPKNKIIGVNGDRLVVDIAAAPTKGKANKELIKFLAKRLGISGRDIQISSGETDHFKSLIIEGISIDDVKGRLLE